MVLTNENYIIFAARHYDNPSCTSTEEFEEDLNRIKYLKKLFYSYHTKGVLREQLIVNHLVILFNVFEARACTKMLILKLGEYLGSLMPFLISLGFASELIENVGAKGNVVVTKDIILDAHVIQKIREIQKGNG